MYCETVVVALVASMRSPRGERIRSEARNTPTKKRASLAAARFCIWRIAKRSTEGETPCGAYFMR